MVELSLVIAIMSVVIAGTLGAAAKHREDARIKATEEKIEYIMQAIKNFVDEFGYIPCPADPTLTFSAGDFGFADYTGTDNPLTDASTTCDTTGSGLREIASNTVAGAIPVYTLNISPDYIFDGWYKRFTYAVDQDLTFIGSDISDMGYIDPDTNGDIVIKNLGMSNNLNEKAAVIIISHGNNGHGAWRGAGGASRITIAGINDTDPDGENSHVLSPLGFDNEFVQSINSANTDDILEYTTKWKLNAN